MNIENKEFDFEAQRVKGHIEKGGYCQGYSPVESLGIGDVSDYRRHPFVLSGYRNARSYSSSFVGIFQLHNETVNIWTHSLGTLYFGSEFINVMIGKVALSNAMGDWVSISVFLFAVTLCLGLSTSYHMFGPMSAQHQAFFLRLDYAGICAQIAGSFVPGLRLGFHCFPMTQRAYLVSIAALVSCSLATAVAPPERYPRVARARIPVTVGTVAFGIVPLCHWSALATAEQRDLYFYRVLAMFLWYMLGFGFYFFRIPECFAPGRFDTFFSSHQIWHCCIVLAAWSWYATCSDWIDNMVQTCQDQFDND